MLRGAVPQPEHWLSAWASARCPKTRSQMEKLGRTQHFINSGLGKPVERRPPEKATRTKKSGCERSLRPRLGDVVASRCSRVAVHTISGGVDILSPAKDNKLVVCFSTTFCAGLEGMSIVRACGKIGGTWTREQPGAHSSRCIELWRFTRVVAANTAAPVGEVPLFRERWQWAARAPPGSALGRARQAGETCAGGHDDAAFVSEGTRHAGQAGQFGPRPSTGQMHIALVF